MSKTVHHYNVYDYGVLILENVTSQEIREALGDNIQCITNYVISGHKFRGRYTFDFVNDSEIKTESELAFEKEWNDAVRPFKNIIWVKEGGRRLHIGGKKRV